jgi:hypothetical protein
MSASRTYNRTWQRGDEVFTSTYTAQSTVAFDAGLVTIPSGTTTRITQALDVSQVVDFMLWNSQAVKVQVNGVNELQRLTPSGTISGGSFTLTFNAVATAAIAFNATAADIKAALEAISTIGVDEVVVTGGPINTTAVDVEFRGTLGCTNVSQMTLSSSLTGGGSVAVSTVTAGVAAAQTLTIPALVGYDWLSIESAWKTFFFTTDWTHLLVSNDSGAPATFAVRGGLNP